MGSIGLAAALGCGLLVASAGTANAAQTRYVPCSAVIIAGTSWLGGQGVDVHSNGPGGASCKGTSVKNKAVQFGGGWQCVELAARLYYVKGWGTVWAGGNGGARYIPEGSPNLQFVPNGSGQLPVPGDLIIEAFGTYGHVTVVDRVEAGRVVATEQNASVSGWKVYPLIGSAITGAYGGGLVRGFMHSPANNSLTPTFASVVTPPQMAPITATATVRSYSPTRLNVAVSWPRRSAASA
ncbi:MAG: CHAP domain-containing protein, partial [Actinomycetes bacterium]